MQPVGRTTRAKEIDTGTERQWDTHTHTHTRTHARTHAYTHARAREHPHTKGQAKEERGEGLTKRTRQRDRWTESQLDREVSDFIVVQTESQRS